jgi:MATE family multidrug resistance protein
MPPRSDVTEASPLLSAPDVHNNAIAHDTSLASRVYDELLDQLDTALPTLQGMVFTKIPWLISLRFVGGIGAHELAAAAMATTLCNVTGLSLSVGLSSALSTLAGQAKGELVSRMIHDKRRRVSFDLAAEEGEGGLLTRETMNKNEEPVTPVIFFWRGMVIQLSMVIPIAIWWLFGVKDVLIALGQAELLSTMTEAYLQVLAPSLLGYSINWTLTAWLQAIGMADVPAKASVLGLILHVPLNYFFIYFLEWGYLGCAVATTCFNIIQPLFLISYLCLYDKGRRRLLESSGGASIGRTQLTFWKEFWISISSIRGYMQYLALALPGIIIISEWWASETAIFLSGRLVPDPTVAVGGMTIYQSINTFCFMFPVAFAISASTRVGNLLGAGQPKGAAFAANVSILSAGCLSFTMGTLLFCIPHTFLPSLFAPGAEDVILETSRTIPLLATYVFADGIQVALNGIIKGCGRQLVTVPIVVVAYWIVGLPLAYYIAFVRHEREMFCEDSYFCGDTGLVAGMTTGTWVHMLLLAIVVRTTTNWELEAQKAKERVAEKG